MALSDTPLDSINTITSVRTLLRNSTDADHVKLNDLPLLKGLMRPNQSLADYHLLLSAYFSIYERLETSIQKFITQNRVDFSYQERRKLPSLTKDLAYFQINPLSDSSHIPFPFDFLTLETVGQLIGILYVLEGSTLGGQMISEVLAKHHGLTIDTGSCFFKGYGEHTQSYWQQFISFAETISDNAQECLLAVVAAKKTFELFIQVLDNYSSLKQS